MSQVRLKGKLMESADGGTLTANAAVGTSYKYFFYYMYPYTLPRILLLKTSDVHRHSMEPRTYLRVT